MESVLEPPLVTEVLPGVWRASTAVTSGKYRLLNNAYLVVDSGEAVMIDTAWGGGSAEHLDALFAISGVNPSQVSEIVLTHVHRDHAGFAAHLEAVTGAPVVLHERERSTAESLTGYQGLPGEDAAVEWYRGHGFPASEARRIVREKLPDVPFTVKRVQWVATGHRVRVGTRELEVIDSPGHTPGHICLVEDGTGVLFSGDALIPRGHGNPHVTARAYTQQDPLSDYVESLLALQRRAEGLRVCLSGHGPAAEDPQRLIREHLAYAESKLKPARDALDETPASAYELASRMPWRGGAARFDELRSDEFFLSFAEALARIRRLVTLGEAIVTTVDGVDRYSLSS